MPPPRRAPALSGARADRAARQRPPAERTLHHLDRRGRPTRSFAERALDGRPGADRRRGARCRPGRAPGGRGSAAAPRWAPWSAARPRPGADRGRGRPGRPRTTRSAGWATRPTRCGRGGTGSRAVSTRPACGSPRRSATGGRPHGARARRGRDPRAGEHLAHAGDDPVGRRPRRSPGRRRGRGRRPPRPAPGRWPRRTSTHVSLARRIVPSASTITAAPGSASRRAPSTSGESTAPGIGGIDSVRGDSVESGGGGLRTLLPSSHPVRKIADFSGLLYGPLSFPTPHRYTLHIRSIGTRRPVFGPTFVGNLTAHDERRMDAQHDRPDRTCFPRWRMTRRTTEKIRFQGIRSRSPLVIVRPAASRSTDGVVSGTAWGVEVGVPTHLASPDGHGWPRRSRTIDGHHGRWPGGRRGDGSPRSTASRSRMAGDRVRADVGKEGKPTRRPHGSRESPTAAAGGRRSRARG